MSASRWKRIESGYYELRNPPRNMAIEIANMRGQSVAWSGLMLATWQVRVINKAWRKGDTGKRMAVLSTEPTMVDAKRVAIEYAERRPDTRGEILTTEDGGIWDDFTNDIIY